MYYADADFKNGSRFMFFIKNISDTDIAKTTSSSETLYMIIPQESFVHFQSKMNLWVVDSAKNSDYLIVMQMNYKHG